jgi:hypothetical protein
MRDGHLPRQHRLDFIAGMELGTDLTVRLLGPAREEKLWEEINGSWTSSLDAWHPAADHSCHLAVRGLPLIVVYEALGLFACTDCE